MNIWKPAMELIVCTILVGEHWMNGGIKMVPFIQDLRYR